MRYIEAFLMKFIMVFAVLFLVLGIAYGVVVFEIFLISLVITVVGFIGDLVIYPKTSNPVATGGDFVLSFVLVWVLGLLWISNLDYSLVLPALYSAALLAIGEWFFHIYLTKRFWEKKETSHTAQSRRRQLSCGFVFGSGSSAPHVFPDRRIEKDFLETSVM